MGCNYAIKDNNILPNKHINMLSREMLIKSSEEWMFATKHLNYIYLFVQELHSLSGEWKVPGSATGLQVGKGEGAEWKGADQAAGQEEEEWECCEEVWHGVLCSCHKVREIKVCNYMY